VLNQVTETYVAKTAEANEDGGQTPMYNVALRFLGEGQALFCLAGEKLIWIIKRPVTSAKGHGEKDR
jgi:hypothetical protein